MSTNQYIFRGRYFNEEAIILNGGDIWGLLRERDYLMEKIVHIEGLMGLAEAKIRELTEETRRLKEENSNLLHKIKIDFYSAYNRRYLFH